MKHRVYVEPNLTNLDKTIQTIINSAIENSLKDNSHSNEEILGFLTFIATILCLNISTVLCAMYSLSLQKELIDKFIDGLGKMLKKHVAKYIKEVEQ